MMGFLLFALSILFAIPAVSVAAGKQEWLDTETVVNESEWQLETGLFILLGDPDFQLSYRPENSRWIYGYRYVRKDREFNLFGMPADESTATLHGPNIRYLYRGSQVVDFYAEATLYHFEYELTCLIAPGIDVESKTSLGLGGGIIFNQNKAVRLNLGLTVAIGGGVALDAGACLDDSERGDDLLASIVFVF